MNHLILIYKNKYTYKLNTMIKLYQIINNANLKKLSLSVKKDRPKGIKWKQQRVMIK